MTPRYEQHFQDDLQYLGGVGKYDLYLVEPLGALRIVWGVAVADWDTYNEGEFRHKEAGRPQGEDLEQIKHYIRLFAPYAYAIFEENPDG